MGIKATALGKEHIFFLLNSLFGLLFKKRILLTRGSITRLAFEIVYF
jgi:hypothetical protein